MTFLKRPRISHTIIAMLGLFALLCAGITGLAAYSIRGLASNENHLVNRHAASLRLTAASQENLTILHQMAFEINDTDPSRHAPLEQKVRAETEELKANFSALRPLVDASDVELFRTAADSVSAYLAVSARLRAVPFGAAKDEALQQSGALEIYERGDAAFDTLIDRAVDRLAQEAASPRS